MSDTGAARGVLRFGVFEVDLRAQELRKYGRSVRLPDQSFQILLLLLESPGQLVTRETVRERLWPTDTFVDFDHGVNAAVNRLREALGDSAGKPRFVETLRKRGYRFIGTVEQSGVTTEPVPNSSVAGFRDEVVGDQKPVAPAASPPRWRVRDPRLAGLAALAAVGAIFLLVAMVSPPPPRVLRYTQITNNGTRKSGLWSDGLRIYYPETTKGRHALVQVSVNGGDANPILTPVDNPFVLDISPDRSELLMRSMCCDNALWVVSVPGGESRRLGGINAYDANWSRDGKQLVYARDQDLYVANADGTESRKLVSLRGAAWVPRWSPDGKVIRFSMFDRPGLLSLWEISADGSNLHAMFPSGNKERYECCGVWTPDGKYYIFALAPNGFYTDSNMWAVREGRGLFRKTTSTPMQLTNGPLRYWKPLLSPDGKRLFVMGYQDRGELMRYDRAVQRFIPYLSGISAEGVNLSRDRTWMVYVRYHEGTLWRSNTDGSRRRQLTNLPLRAGWPQLSPDEKWVTFVGSTAPMSQVTNSGSVSKIYRVSVEGGSTEQLVAGDGLERWPVWAPDGKFILFEVNSPSGKQWLNLLDLTTRETSILPGSEGLGWPSWSPDGRFICATGPGEKLLLFDVAAQKWTTLFDAQPRAAYHPMWSHDAKYVYFSDLSQANTPFLRVRVADRKVEQVSTEDFPAGPVRGDYMIWTGLAPDDSPLLLRDSSFEEVYAFDVDFP